MVIDKGQGFPDNKVKELFQPYYYTKYREKVKV